MALSEQTKARWEQKKRELAAAAPAEAAPRNDSIQQKWEQKKRELAMQRQQAAPAAAKPAVKPSIAGASRAVTDTGTGGGMPRRALPATPAAGRLTEEAFDRSPVLQERYGSYQRYAAQNKRYYARPELGGDTDRLRGDYSTYETAARDALRAYEKAEEKQKTTEGTLENLKQSLPALQQSFQRDPSALNNALYQTVLQRYESLAAQYAQEAEDAQRRYGDYEQSLGKYQDALRTYRDYLTGEQEKYQDWRSAIRTDENAIGRDLAAANAKVEQLQARKEQLQRQAKQLMDKAYPRNSGTDGLLLQAQALQEQVREVDDRIAKARSAAGLLQEELDWKKYYQYADLMEAEDFAEKSRYVSTETGEAPKLGLSGVYRDTGFGDINYDIINRNETARGRQGVSDINSNASFLGLDHGERGQMTDDEIAIFNYLYAQDTARGDAEHRTAYEYIDYLTKELNYRRRQKEEAYWKEYARESPVGSSAFSILTSPMKGLSYIGQAADYLGTGKIDQNAGYNRLSYVNSAIRGQVSETIEQSGKWGKAGSFLYQTGMSMGDFLMNSLVTGAMAGEAVLGEKAFQIASNLSLAIMGTGAAADATIAAKDRGLTDKQAFTLGTVAGAAEVFTEKFSIEALLNGKWEDGALKYILKNAFTEGSEEVGSDFINLFADILVAKDKSEWRQTIDAYMAAGKTESEAFALAVAQQAAEMGLDFLGGALSGGTMASVGAGIGAVRNQVQYRQDGGQLRGLGDEMTRGILEEAEALDPNSEAYKLGQRLKKKQEKGKRLTDAEIGRLYAETTRALEQTEQAAPQPAQGQPQQTVGTELPTPDQTGGVMLPTPEQTEAQTQQRAAEQERQTAPPRETAEMAQPGVLPTAEETDRRQRAASAQTETERTGILLGVNDDTIARVLRISSAVGREVVFFDAGADAAGGIENGHFDPEDGRIHINAQSQNPAAQIISHELTHSIEGGGSYGDLQRLVLQRIQQDGGDLQALRQQKAELYARHGKALKASEVDAEIVAEYVEKHLLTDEQSIREMVRQDRTLGQRILDFIDRLLAKLGSGSAQERAFLTKARSYYRSALQETQSSFTAEMRQQAETQAAGMEGMEPRLERLRQQMASGEISDTEAEAVYEQTYNSEEDLRQGLGGLQHSIEELPDGKKYVRADRQVIFGNDPRSWSEQLEDYINGKIRRGGDVTLIGADGDALRLTATSAGKLSDYHTGDGRTMSSDAFERKVNAASHIDELAQTSVRGPKTVADYGSRHGAAASGGWNYRTAHFMDFDGKYYEVRISVALGADGKMIYNIGQIQERSIPQINGSSSQTRGAQRGDAPADSIFTSGQNVNGNIGQMKKEAHPKIKGSRANNDDGPRGFASSDNSISISGQDVNRKSEGRKYSIGKTTDNKAFVEVEQDILSGVPEKDWVKTVKENLKQKFPDGITVGNNEIQIDGRSRQEMTFSRYMQWLYNNDPQLHADKLRATNNADEILFATTDWVNEGLNHPRKDRIADFARGNVLLRVGGNDYTANVVVGTKKNGSMALYDVLNLQPTSFTEKETDAAISTNPSPGAARSTASVSANSISETGQDVNGKKDTTQELSRGVTVSGSLADTTSVVSTDSVRGFDENVNSKYSLSEEDAGDDAPAATLPTGQEESAKEESAKKQTEAEYQAERLGYPILNGVQVVPMRTYVHATDIIRDENNNIVYEKDGKPKRRDNYGMVVGQSPYDADELIVAFRNDEKHTRKDEVFISIDDLEVALPRGDSEGQRMAILMEQEPVQPDNKNMSAEDRAELNEMLNRAQAKEMARRAPLEELEPVKREEVTGKARVKLEQAERALVRRVGRALSVPRFAQREYLQEIAQRISEEYLTTGRVSEKTATELFEQAYQKGIVVDEAFYQQYKDIKEHLRTQAVTISEEDKHDIADWSDFRKSAFGQLRIVNQGGTPVDIAYEELRSMAPALFPYDISHPADQLVRMLEVAQSIEKTEKSLNEYYGPDAEEFKRWAKNDFKEAVYDSLQELRTVKRYADERTAKANAAAEAAITPEQAAEAYRQLKKARWETEKAKAKNLLTDHDKIQLGRLLRGEIELQHLDPDTDNVKGIRAVYEATAEYERLVKLLTDYKKRQRAALLEAADRYLETANDWKDKRTGLAYARETMERNFEDIVPDRKLAKEIVREYITPVHDAEANATRFKTEYRDKVRALELSRKVAQGNEVSEAHAVQLLGEAMDNIRILENSRGRMAERDGKTLEDWQGVVQDLRAGNPNLNWEKINGAIESFRKIYDELFRRLNDVRVRFGYEPINYRSGYFPHFQPGDGGDGILSQFGRAMGIDTQVTALPTSINGLTHNFKPGITWFGNAQQRLGFNTAYDAVEGFDKYIEGAASVIFQTENIQRLRALATQMRYRTGDEGLRKQVDAVRADPRLTEEEKQSKINEIHKEGRFVLSNFVNELDEYTNLLANKKSRFDRGIEAALGRRVYRFLKNWESRVGANMIAGNLSSALTNFIPLTQARGQIGRASMLKGMWDTLKAYRNDDGFADRSSFLTNRRGSDPIVKSWSQRASGILGKPMEYIDTFTADSIVRARYDQNLRRGLSEAEAMSEADAFAGKVMADRSKGSMPTLFESKNPIFKAFTQFQLEVNNQFSEVFKDLPRAYRDKGLAALAAALFKYFIGAFLFNEVYEYIVGRRPALDPIGLLNDTAGDLTGYALPNLVELGVGAAQGELPSFQTEKASLGETGKNLAQNALGELPFSSGLALLGADIDGGRLPAASAVPDLTALWDAATKEGWSGKRRWKEVQDELSKLAYILPPFGGNQAQKIWKSVKALLEGGSYTVDADGSKKLQYPVFTDDPWETALNAGRMMLFGKSSLPTAQDWVEDNFNTLGAKQTAAYQDMLEAGVRGEAAFALLQELRGAEKTDEQSRNAVQREILRRSDVPGEGKAITYYALLASDRERELMDALDGADPGAVTEMLLDIKDAGTLKGAAASGAKREAIARAPLTDEEKQTVYRYVMGTKQEDGSYATSREDDIIAFRQAGLDFDTFLKVQNEYTAVNEKYSGAGEKAMAFSRWVNSLDLTAAQAETVRDCFRYFSQIPAEAARYDSFVSAGLDDDAAYALADALNALEPEEGKKTVSNVQRYRAVIEADLGEDEQMAALQELMQESEYSKLQVGYEHGILPEAYVRFRELLPQYDADGNGTLNQKEVEKALDSMGGGVGLVLPGGSGGDQPLTVKQQAVLWQLANKSWKPNKNPYSTSVGRKVYDALNAEPASGGILLPDGTGGLELPRG